jgi:Glyoxalase-like domain
VSRNQEILDIDHVYIMVAPNAPEAAYLASQGLFLLTETAHHEGQGTAARFFMFKNMYLELVWIEDEDAHAQHSTNVGVAATPPTNWASLGILPFGVGLHGKVDDTYTLPLEAKEERAPWMLKDDFIMMIPSVLQHEPSYFVLHGRLAYRDFAEDEVIHPIGVEYLTQLTITTTSGAPFSPMSQLLVDQGILTLKYGDAPLLELTFDNHRHGQTLDARPTLPLLIHY